MLTLAVGHVHDGTMVEGYSSLVDKQSAPQQVSLAVEQLAVEQEELDVAGPAARRHPNSLALVDQLGAQVDQILTLECQRKELKRIVASKYNSNVLPSN